MIGKRHSFIRVAEDFSFEGNGLARLAGPCDSCAPRTAPFMRFAYIDSNGNEVPIPSVDALALRIELGAITEKTQLYDAQAEQWAPARSHEIFHSLSRTTGDGGGFVAPPPVAPPSTGQVATMSPKVQERVDPPATEPRPAAASTTTPASKTSAGDAEGRGEASPPAAEAGDPKELSPDDNFGLTLAEPEPEEEEEWDEEEGEETPDPAFGLTLADAEPDPFAMSTKSTEEESPQGADPKGGSQSAAPVEGEGDEPVEEVEEDRTFDFGELDGGLEVEEAPEELASAGEGAMDLTGVGGPPMAGLVGGEVAEPDFSGGLELETSMQFDGGGFALDEGEALDLATPMAHFGADAPPAWMEQDGPEGAADQDVMDFSSVASATKDEPDAVAPTKGAPAKERKKPKRRRRRELNLAGPIVSVVAILAVSVGGYVAWPLVTAELAASSEAEPMAVQLPSIPSELEPELRLLAGAALSAAFDDAGGEWAGGEAVEAPPGDWLAGVYLANASAYPAVSEFWERISEWLDAVRAIDGATFAEAFDEAAAGSELSAESMSVVRDRALAGFAAGTGDREDIYDRAQALVDASLRLHQFLVANEANIDYVPARAATTDPILEATADPAVREALDELIDDITRSLGGLGYRDQVTGEGLRARVLSTVQERGIR